ncbi:MAG: uroporphyrinogen-III synthase [Actinomycetota bacterium]|nr:uroporphyrinogen-III synthase [Actinomycetota bacterium]
MLAGATVVVTRPKGDADDLAEALRAAGARVVALPVVEIAEPEDGGAGLARAVAALPQYRWVVFTSANAVRRLLALVPDVGVLAGAGLAAVGPATAAALGERGLVADLVAERTSAEGLADLFPAAAAPGASVLFPAAAGARRTLPDALRAKGWAVDEVIAYRTVPAPAPPAALAAEVAAASAVTFASPSAVDAYVALRAQDGKPLAVPPVVACIGPLTAAAARVAGLEVGVVARHASASELVAALAGALAGAPSVPRGGVGARRGAGARARRRARGD